VATPVSVGTGEGSGTSSGTAAISMAYLGKDQLHSDRRLRFAIEEAPFKNSSVNGFAVLCNGLPGCLQELRMSSSYLKSKYDITGSSLSTSMSTLNVTGFNRVSTNLGEKIFVPSISLFKFSVSNCTASGIQSTLFLATVDLQAHSAEEPSGHHRTSPASFKQSLKIWCENDDMTMSSSDHHLKENFRLVAQIERPHLGARIISIAWRPIGRSKLALPELVSGASDGSVKLWRCEGFKSLSGWTCAFSVKHREAPCKVFLHNSFIICFALN
jgi:hypothetical protein